MKKNVGGVDKIVRMVIGAGLVLGGLLYPMRFVWRLGLIIVGGLTLFNAVIGV
jgi:hypothetical protein